MAEEILNPEVNTEPEINEDELFYVVDNNLSDSEKIDAPRYSYWRSVVRSFFRNKINIFAIASLLVILALAFIQPIFSDFERMGNVEGQLSYPPFKNWEYIFGTDRYGNSIWDATWSGTQFSMTLAFVATAINMTLGILVGALWGYSKVFDKIFTEIYNIIANVPSLVITLIIMYSFTEWDNYFWKLILAFSLTGWLGIGYSFRTQVIIIRDRDYNLASRCLGTGVLRMITHNILPFLVSIIVTYITNYLPSFIGQEVFLAYIGINIPGEISSLGTAINNGIKYISDPEYSHTFWIPVAVSAIVTITLYVAGQGLADASDPKNHR